MPRIWGTTSAQFYELDQVTAGSPVNVGGVTSITTVIDNTVEWNRITSGIGRGRASFYATGNWDQFIVPARVCMIYKAVSGYDPIVARVVACFIIEDVEPGVDANGLNIVTASGPGMESLLTRKPVWVPIGEEEIIEVSLLNTAAGPATTTLSVGAPAGNDSATLASVSGVDVDDEVRIRMGASNDGDWHIARVTAVNPPTAPAGTIQFTPDIPSDAAAGNSVEVRTAGLSLTSAGNMANGQRVEITLDNATVFETLIVKVNSSINAVYIRDGLTSIATAGNTVRAYDYSARTSSDVTQIMQYAPEWEVQFQTGNGSAEGTAHVPKGESVFDLLSAIAERTGEFFRHRILVSGLPAYLLDWRRTADNSGVQLIMYDTDEQARQAADELNIGKGAIFKLRGKQSQPVITRVYPRAGDGEVTLRYCSAQAVTNAVVDGFTVHVSDDLYEPDYVESTEDPLGIHSVVESYGDISANDAGNPIGLTAAADQLLLSAMNTLYQARGRMVYTIEAFVPSLIHPGQYVSIENETRSVPNPDTPNSFVVLETTERLVNGRPRTTLLVSPYAGMYRSAAVGVARMIRSVIQSQRRMATRASSTATRSVTVGGGSSGSDHGGLTGLLDDDHPQYLRTDGSRTLTGNMLANAGVTIDGVDLSAHAANPSAHHSPVTRYNSGIFLSGQAVGVLLGPTSGMVIRPLGVDEGLSVLLQSPSGLDLSASGLAVAEALAGDGLRMASKVMHIDLDPTGSGLTFNSGYLRLGVPTAISANGVGGVSGSGHGHAVIATALGHSTFDTLLKNNTEGGLSLGRLSVGTANNSVATAFFRSKVVDDVTVYLQQMAGQTADLWRVENSAGNPLIRLTGGGDLESGTPAFVSGLTGWEITSQGDVEFNNAFIRGELHATVFVADEMHATGGTVAVMTATTVAPSVGAADNKLPGIGASFTLNVTASLATGLCYFAANDIIRIKSMTDVVNGGSLNLYDIYLQVTSVGSIVGRDLANGEAGYHPITVVRRRGGALNHIIPAGAAAVRWGRVGQTAGSYTGGVILTSDLNHAPYIDIFTVPADRSVTDWQSGTVLPTPHVREGNLRGVLGKSADEWGIAAGTNLADGSLSARYIVASDQGILLNNVDLKAYYAGNPTIHLAYTGDVRFGTDTSGDATTTFFHQAASGSARLGPYVNGKPFLLWDNAAGVLGLYQRAGGVNNGVILLNASGESFFAGPMTLGANGGIWQGTGSFAAPTTGLKLSRVGNSGVLEAWNGGVRQAAFDSDGRFKAGWNSGAWNVVLDANGIEIQSEQISVVGAALSLPYRRINFKDGATALGWIGGRKETYGGLLTGAEFALDGSTYMRLLRNPGGGGGSVQIKAQTTINMDAATDIVLSATRVSAAGAFIGTGVLAGDLTAGVSAFGQITSDLLGNGHNAVILRDAAQVNHGMTGLVITYTYGAMGKVGNTTGGLRIGGYTEDAIGAEFGGYATNASTINSTTALAAVVVNAAQKSGTGVTSFAAGANLFAVRNNGASRLLVKGNGDLYVDGASGTYDDHDDVRLLRAADLALAGHDIDGEFAAWLRYNRADLERLGLIDGTFVNLSRMQRLITGAIWQLDRRLRQVEAAL